jgi:predicted acyl esterase
MNSVAAHSSSSDRRALSPSLQGLAKLVPARDGVLLYRPDGPGPFPVLLERTPYDKSAASRSERSA